MRQNNRLFKRAWYSERIFSKFELRTLFIEQFKLLFRELPLVVGRLPKSFGWKVWLESLNGTILKLASN